MSIVGHSAMKENCSPSKRQNTIKESTLGIGFHEKSLAITCLRWAMMWLGMSFGTRMNGQHGFGSGKLIEHWPPILAVREHDSPLRPGTSYFTKFSSNFSADASGNCARHTTEVSST